MKKQISAFFALVFVGATIAAAQSAPALKLVDKIKMPPTVKGRFDHLGADAKNNRLFVAAETAHEVPVFNLRTGEVIHEITGIGIPHAIFSRDDLNRIYVTDGEAGELKIYDGSNYKLLKSVKLKVDADSIGYDPATHYLYIDNGGGDAHEKFSMFSIVDTTAGEKVADIQIDGDTLEAMALTTSTPLIYVNNRAKNQVEVVDRKVRKVVASWPVTMGKINVAMALDESTHRLFVACRSGEIVIFDTETGKELQALPIRKGVDDLVFDAATKRLYAACGAGEGAISVYQQEDKDHYKSLGQVPSGPGGKNEVLVPELSRLYIIVPQHGNNPSEIYAYATQ